VRADHNKEQNIRRWAFLNKLSIRLGGRCSSTVAGDLGTNRRHNRFNRCGYTNLKIVHRCENKRHDLRVRAGNVFGIELVEALVVGAKSVGFELSERLQVLPIEGP
jgi:hypothetical protein